MQRGREPLVTVLTGPRGSGKTRFCSVLAARHSGVAALISPACEDGEGRRFGIDSVVLPGGARFALARVVDPDYRPQRASEEDGLRHTLAEAPQEEAPPEEVPPEGVILGPYRFSRQALGAAGDALRQELLQGDHRLAVLDEIGPLELNRGEGFSALLRDLLRGAELPLLPLVVVVRPSLVATLCNYIRRERKGCSPVTIGVGEGGDAERPAFLRSLLR
ncbi:Nucleoside-triphosphatase THEP1 [Alkalispirochaeta americana]|uniref:Nucleoside-triphosphatase THEP1 n=1 Tax=Alkalispirochaeta americana TaxID=159291 RepID=A0A1N6TDD9_9SPIO|nr:AAA family ATPase [Alkalispirochaeta americana]SIQ51379.1 Nucleoside-triphosphatase THEP1 [Alkalispirochaeta americana]